MLQLAEQRVHAEGPRLVGDDRHDAAADVGVAQQVAQQPGERGGRGPRPGRRSRRAARRTSVVGRLSGRRRARRAGAGPPSARSRADAGSWCSRSPRRADVGRDRRRRGPRRGSTSLEVQAVAQRPCSCAAVIFLIWWVALRPSNPGPSVQPLIVFARMTVGSPSVLGGRLVGGVELVVVVPAAGQASPARRRRGARPCARRRGSGPKKCSRM